MLGHESYLRSGLGNIKNRKDVEEREQKSPKKMLQADKSPSMAHAKNMREKMQQKMQLCHEDVCTYTFCLNVYLPVGGGRKIFLGARGESMIERKMISRISMLELRPLPQFKLARKQRKTGPAYGVKIDLA